MPYFAENVAIVLSMTAGRMFPYKSNELENDVLIRKTKLWREK
jgi:hypothetical protein